MVEENAPAAVVAGGAPDMGWHPTGATPKDPGWYPAGTNPNHQTYWDGETWTGRRSWTVNGWLEDGSGLASAASSAGAPVAAPSRLSGNPYATGVVHGTQSRAAPATMNIGLLLLMICGIALMFGSVGTWVSVKGSVGIAAFHVSINGTDQGIANLIHINGYVTFIGGIVLLVLAGVALTNNDLLLAILTTVVAAATLIVAIYDMFRIVQKISQVSTSATANVSVGWGLIAVLSAATLAILVALVRLASR
jgi:hypothetical protein